jgi:hypothetical protein
MHIKKNSSVAVVVRKSWAKFWPVYDKYIAEVIAINDRKFGLIQEYADNWGKLTND